MSLRKKIAELQDKRLGLQNKLREHADKLDNDSTLDQQGEWKQTWDSLNSAYDDNKSGLDSSLTQLSDQQDIQNRLEEVSSHTPSNIPVNIGRDTFELRDENAAVDIADPVGTAMQGWFLNHTPSRQHEVTDIHRQAASTAGFKLNSNTIDIKLYDTQQLREHNVQNAMTTHTGSTGGVLVGETLVASLERALSEFGGMRQVAEMIRTTTGEPLRWPTVNDTSNSGRQLGESTAITATDPSFAQVLWNAYKFSSDEILVPHELLEDSVIDLPSVLGSLLGERLGRITNTKFTTGTGAGTPKGITVAAAAGVTAASATAIAFDEIIDLEHTIDPAIRRMPGVGYMFHDGILQAVRKLKNGSGDYLWQAGANSGSPDTLNTYAYTVNQDMQATVATGTITMVFGRLSQYKIREVNSIRLFRLVERHRESDQDAFLAFLRADGNLLDSGDSPVKKLTQA